MHNCLILGSGRSGTSMAAGLLSKSGYFFGKNLVPPRPANPKGFFESSQINHDVNEEILQLLTPKMQKGWRWLALIPPDTHIPKVDTALDNMRKMADKEPYCYKDPRFSYTLSVIRPALKKNTKFICVFRNPASTAASIMKECKTAKYLSGIHMDIKTALRVWNSMYTWILDIHSKKGDWLFLHYDQLLDKKYLDKMSNFLDADVDYSFPDKKLKKNVPPIPINDRVSTTYKRLMENCS